MNVKVIKRKGQQYAVPFFKLIDSEDIMIKGGKFYAIWDEKKGLWNKNKGDAIKIIDSEIKKVADESGAIPETCEEVSAFKSSDKLNKYLEKDMWDWHKPLDTKVIFANDKTTKEDYATFKLNYSLEDGPTPNWDKLVSTLYKPEER